MNEVLVEVLDKSEVEEGGGVLHLKPVRSKVQYEALHVGNGKRLELSFTTRLEGVHDVEGDQKVHLFDEDAQGYILVRTSAQVS